MKKKLSVKCPQCSSVFSYYESEWRPFCSERCKLIDLGHWFNESYRVPTKEKDNEKEQDEDHQNEHFPEQERQGEDEESDY